MKILLNYKINPGDTVFRIRGLVKANGVFHSQMIGSHIAVIANDDEKEEVKEYSTIALRNGSPAPDKGQFIGIAFFNQSPFQVFFLDAKEYGEIKKAREEEIEKAEADKKKEIEEKQAAAEKEKAEKQAAAEKEKTEKENVKKTKSRKG